MGQILLFVIVGVIIFVGFVLTVSRRTREEAAGICVSALDQTVRKNANKEKALTLVRERGEISNSEIREALGVASRTAVKYMTELESEGKVEQVGDIGRGVFYRLKQEL